MIGETTQTTQGTWRELAQALCAAQRAERRHGYSSRHYQEAYRSYLAALADYQTAASAATAQACRTAGYQRKRGEGDDADTRRPTGQLEQPTPAGRG